jgi:undecaprenyl-phosphate 4-deoxy-4-formamido-L-arabinose transferase
MKQVSVVIPVYNSAESLPLLMERLSLLRERSQCIEEVIFVNDGSRDQSWSVILELSRQYHWLRGFNLMRNFGQHNALLSGIRAATGEIVVTMDDDLQNPPEEIPLLLAKLAEGYDVVYGAPEKEQHGLLRDLASRITKIALQAAMGVETARDVSAFRAFRTRIRDAFANFKGSYVSIDVLLTWGARRFTSIRVRHEPRTLGVSNYTVRKLMVHALNMITGFSILPLQVASIVGFLFTLFGIGVLAFVLLRYAIQGGSVPGFPFLASVVAIFSGAQLFALGIMGEYLARVHFRLMDRPTYVVEDTIGTKQAPTRPL